MSKLDQPTTPNPPKGQEKGTLSFQRIQTASVLLLTLLLCIISSLKTEGFFSWYNLVENLITNAAALGIIACGMTLVMIAGGFDLSVASITVACSVITVMVLQLLAPHGIAVALPIALLSALLLGTVLGCVNGILVAYVGVNPFVVTLSTMLVFRGIAFIITHGGQSIQVPKGIQPTFEKLYWGRFFSFTFAGKDHPLMIPIALFVIVFLIFYYLLRFTRFGHYVYAVGGNENATWLAGVNTSLVKAATYTLTGLTCAISAVIFAAQSSTAQADTNKGLEMQVIASVIVGGTPLGGGTGSLLRTLNGLMLLAVIENMLGQFNVPEEYRNIVRGVIILIVVTVDLIVRRKGRK